MQLQDWPYIRGQLDGVNRLDDTTGILAVKGNVILGAAVFDMFTAHSCRLHHLIRWKWIIRQGWGEEVFGFAFRHVGIIYGWVAENNEQALKFNKHLGFTEHAYLEEAIEPGIGYVVMAMREEDCRWVGERQMIEAITLPELPGPKHES